MKPAKTICNGCGQEKSVKKVAGAEFCPGCAEIADALNERPDLIRKIAAAIHADPLPRTSAEREPAPPRELPEVLDAVRFRTRDRELNTWYVSVSELEGNPVEIFASTAFDRDQHLQSRISNLTTITRLISLILRHIFLGEIITLEKTLKQLHRSSRQKNDLPDMLVKVLCNYCKTPHEFDS